MRIFIFAFLLTLFSLVSGNYWEAKSAKVQYRKYEALLVRRNYDAHTQKHIEEFCLGVILNRKYILTIASCTGGLIKIFLGFTLFYENIKDNETTLTSDGTTYEIGKVIHMWPSIYDQFYPPGDFLALVRTKTSIGLDANISCVRLPDNLNRRYMEPGKVTSFLFHRIKSSAANERYEYPLYVLNGIRDCNSDMINNIPIWLIPSCIYYRYIDGIFAKYVGIKGNPLVCNRTVVGMKNYRGYIPRFPLFGRKIELDQYLNVALYSEIIKSYMSNFTPCAV